MRAVRLAVVAALVGAGLAVPAASADAAGKTLRIGGLFPKTGNLSLLGPAAIDGTKLAVKDINAAGGVFGHDVQLEIANSGDVTTDTATASVKRLIKHGADAIVGPSSSAVALTVIDRVVAAGKVMTGASTSSTVLSEYPDRGLYFRMVPSDRYQGTVIGQQAHADGAKRLAILGLQDAYGTQLADAATKAFRAAGGTVVSTQIYDPLASSFAGEVARVKAAKPDAIAIFGFDETANILDRMRTDGLLPQQSARVYLVDGNLSGTYSLPKDTLTGVRGVMPGSIPSSAFQARLKKFDPKLRDYSFAAEVYDATVLDALAAAAAKSDKGSAIAAKLDDVSKSGTVCHTFKSCMALLKKGKNIDYDGQSGHVQFDSLGDVRQGRLGVYQYGADNTYHLLKQVSGRVPSGRD